MIKKWFRVLCIIGVTALVCGFILEDGDDHAKRAAPFKAPGVQVVSLDKTDYRLKVPARGIVRAGAYADIRSDIPGKIKTVSSGVYPGARVNTGTLLFTLDDRQYRLQLQEAEAVCQTFEQALNREQGRQALARHQWQMLKTREKYTDEEKLLALRRPQLITCRAELKKARARRDLVAYNLKRTRISAPCNGIILTESICPGVFIGPDAVALRLACTDTFQITAKFAPHMAIDPGQREALITIGRQQWHGRIKSRLPGTDPKTGQKAVLVEFKSKSAGILNCHASLTLNGALFTDVYVIGRDAVRTGNTVWRLDENDTLAITPFTFLGRDGHHVVAKGLQPHTRLIVSHLSNPIAGMALDPLPHENPEQNTENP